MSDPQKTCIVISGPTAVGKTSVSLFLASHFNVPILSFDSRQCYRELNIGVAKPTKEELELTRHYFINSHSIFDEVNAADFGRYAENAASEIFSRHNLLIMVGGTGLYLHAFLEGMDEIPPIDANIRQQLRHQYVRDGFEWLQETLRREDPAFLQLTNPQRMLRALEVKLSTGRSLVSYQQSYKKERPFKTIKIALDRDRSSLYERINFRVNQMMKDGLEDEARSLIPFKHLNALNTVGYKELFDFFSGEMSLSESVAAISQHTRNYAKRQLTWFKKDAQYKWFHADSVEELKNYCIHEIDK